MNFPKFAPSDLICVTLGQDFYCIGILFDIFSVSWVVFFYYGWYFVLASGCIRAPDAHSLDLTKCDALKQHNVPKHTGPGAQAVKYHTVWLKQPPGRKKTPEVMDVVIRIGKKSGLVVRAHIRCLVIDVKGFLEPDTLILT